MTVERIEAALLKVAVLVERDPSFSPIFERLEAELEAAQLAEGGRTDAQERAARLLAQNATGRRRSAACSSDAPAP